MSEAPKIRVRLVRSPIGTTRRQRETLKALGLTKVGKVVSVAANAATLGRIAAVQHLVEVQS
ncbi:MAG: hypothetical protein KatS3mg077_0163 [Candidatus Binatia bacterium]|nr:MAG: hypothetical protein KatS3mg077_0163 [Candidatus Binatia bacterium]